MAKLTRRGLLKQAPVGVATVGMLGAVPSLVAVPGMAAINNALDAPEAEVSAAALAEPLFAHVRDIATGEVSLLVGTREIIYRDPELVSRLLRAAH